MAIQLSSLKKKLLVMRTLRWDVTPEVLFKPRFTGPEKNHEILKETQGYMFYIDSLSAVPKLMLMRTIEMMSSTFGEIEGVPEKMLLKAVKVPEGKPMGGMYPIDSELEQWLKGQLGIKG